MADINIDFDLIIRESAVFSMTIPSQDFTEGTDPDESGDIAYSPGQPMVTETIIEAAELQIYTDSARSTRLGNSGSAGEREQDITLTITKQAGNHIRFDWDFTAFVVSSDTTYYARLVVAQPDS